MVARPSRSRMRMASRTGPRLTWNESARRCSFRASPGRSLPLMMASPTCAAICSGTVSVGVFWRPSNRRKATAFSRSVSSWLGLGTAGMRVRSLGVMLEHNWIVNNPTIFLGWLGGAGCMGRFEFLETPAPAGEARAATSLGSGAPPGALGPLRGLPSLQLAARASPAGGGSQYLGFGSYGLRRFQVSDTPGSVVQVDGGAARGV